MIFTRQVQFDSVFHVITVNKISWDRSKIIFGYFITPCCVLSRDWIKTYWSFSRRLFCSSLLSGLSRIKKDVLRYRSLPEILTNPSATGNMKVSPFIDVNTSFALSLLAWTPAICSTSSKFWCVHLLQFFNNFIQNVYCPDFTRAKDVTEEYTWQDFRTKLMYSQYVLRRNWVIFDHCSKRNYWSVKWLSDSSFVCVFPSDKWSWMFCR